MIIFQTANYQYDLTNRGISFTENSDYFSENISKNFSFPFYVYLQEEFAEKLGLVNIENVRSYKSKIYGYLIIDNNFYDAYISVNEIISDKAEVTLFYGKETLPVFDKYLNQLPFKAISATGGLATYAKTLITKQWPDTSHNYVKMYRPEIAKEDNYELFQNFVNNYDVNQAAFLENSIDVIESENVSVNRNVMCPFPYLLEIFKVAFASEGLEIRGDFVNDDFNKKIVYIPKTFFEHYYVSQFENYSFSNHTSQKTVAGKTINVYKHIHTPTSEGSYSLKINLNMTDAMAKYFKLKVTQDETILFEANSENNQVAINQTLDINIVNTTIFENIEVELNLLSQDASISDFNNFTFEYKEGQLNVFPETYTLADFMPDMTVRNFVNKIKVWLNLKFDYTKNAVYINYLDTIFTDLPINNQSHLQDPDKSRTLNKNNLFKLSYPDGQEVLVNKNGQTYSDTDYVDSEIEKIELEVLPLQVNSNNDVITAVYPEDEEDLMFCLYNGTIADEPLATNNINNRKLDLQHIYNNNYKNWLKFRANAEIYKDNFKMHISEKLDFKTAIFKYNKVHLIKSINKKRINKEYWKVELETETI